MQTCVLVGKNVFNHQLISDQLKTLNIEGLRYNSDLASLASWIMELDGPEVNVIKGSDGVKSHVLYSFLIVAFKQTWYQLLNHSRLVRIVYRHTDIENIHVGLVTGSVMDFDELFAIENPKPELRQIVDLMHRSLKSEPLRQLKC